MVVDLAGVYKQPVDMEMAVNFVGQLGKNLIAILGVSAATSAVVWSVARHLKNRARRGNDRRRRVARRGASDRHPLDRRDLR